MTGTSLRDAVLAKLLNAYERSASFGRPAPWRRDVLVRFDAATFPRAFAADGREEREALATCIDELERDGALRTVRHAGLAHGELREIRLGPNELDAAFSAARALGFEPLGAVLTTLAGRARDAAQRAESSWASAYLHDAARALDGGDTSPCGMSRERIKRDARALGDAFDALAAIADGACGWERMVSERVFGDSKRLGAIRPVVASLLVRADPRWAGAPVDEEIDVLEAYGIRRRPGILRCAGRSAIAVAGRTYALDDFAPTAHLPEAWGASLADGLARAPSLSVVTTIENEYPFLSYVEEAGGPMALGNRGELVVYTSGFPAPSTVDLLVRVSQARPDVSFRHWGDADVGGLRIWLHLRRALGRSIALYRTTAAWLEAEAARGGTALSPTELSALARLREDIIASAPPCDDALALADALLRLKVKIEQERF